MLTLLERLTLETIDLKKRNRNYKAILHEANHKHQNGKLGNLSYMYLQCSTYTEQLQCRKQLSAQVAKTSTSDLLLLRDLTASTICAAI